MLQVTLLAEDNFFSLGIPLIQGVNHTAEKLLQHF